MTRRFGGEEAGCTGGTVKGERLAPGREKGLKCIRLEAAPETMICVK